MIALAAPAFAVFAPADAYVDATLESLVGQRAAAAEAMVAGPLRAACALYLVLHGIAVMRGAVREPVLDLAVRGVKIAFIVFLATTPAYGTYVQAPLVTSLPAAVASAFGDAGASSPGQAFDQILARSAYMGEALLSGGDPLNLPAGVMAIAVFAAGALVSGVGFAISLTARLALSLLAALGPVFISLALFGQTRRWFFGWASQAVNYLTLTAISLIFAHLLLGLIAAECSALQGADPMTGALSILTLLSLCGVVFIQTPAIAAGVAGGAHLGFDLAAALALRAARGIR